MSDVRSLLKSERATRQIDHPQASYTATGTLECIICKLPIRSDTETWNKHLKSPQHAMRAERLRVSSKQQSTAAAQSSAAASHQEMLIGGKKRKADHDENQDDTRKRTRPEDQDSSKFTKRKVSFDEPLDTDSKPPTKLVEIARSSPNQDAASPPPQASTEPVNEDEWAAFEATLAWSSSTSPPPPDTSAATALAAAATISAAPRTAAQLAAQSREEASLQSKERREAEVEAEKEDAARQLEEEFDEMEELEERVRKLREQRERLRLNREKVVEERELQDMGKREPLIEPTTCTDGAAAGRVRRRRGVRSGSDEDFDAWGELGSQGEVSIT